MIVEHDKRRARADYVIALGPGAGMHGGEVFRAGTLHDIERHATSETGRACGSFVSSHAKEAAFG